MKRRVFHDSSEYYSEDDREGKYSNQLRQKLVHLDVIRQLPVEVTSKAKIRMKGSDLKKKVVLREEYGLSLDVLRIWKGDHDKPFMNIEEVHLWSLS
jgi:hypothetical protein